MYDVTTVALGCHADIATSQLSQVEYKLSCHYLRRHRPSQFRLSPLSRLLIQLGRLDFVICDMNRAVGNGLPHAGRFRIHGRSHTAAHGTSSTTCPPRPTCTNHPSHQQGIARSEHSSYTAHKIHDANVPSSPAQRHAHAIRSRLLGVVRRMRWERRMAQARSAGAQGHVERACTHLIWPMRTCRRRRQRPCSSAQTAFRGPCRSSLRARVARGGVSVLQRTRSHDARARACAAQDAGTRAAQAGRPVGSLPVRRISHVTAHRSKPCEVEGRGTEARTGATHIGVVSDMSDVYPDLDRRRVRLPHTHVFSQRMKECRPKGGSKHICRRDGIGDERGPILLVFCQSKVYISGDTARLAWLAGADGTPWTPTKRTPRGAAGALSCPPNTPCNRPPRLVAWV